MLRTIVKIPIKKFWFILLGLTLFFMIWVNQTIRSTKLSYEIQKLEEDLKKEERKFTQLKMSHDQFLSLESIEKKAKELGFELSKEDNITFIPIKDYRIK